MKRNETDVHNASDFSTQLRIAEKYVGYRILIAHADGFNVGVWATVVKVVSSRADLHWLVDYDNGAIGVVRIFGNTESFTLQPASARATP
jgi:hypothetical protein